MTEHSLTRGLIAQLPGRATPLEVEVVRELRREDLATQSAPAVAQSLLPSISALRQSHHQLARLLAQGTPTVEASLVTGYSIGHIGNLKQNETFQELLAHYAKVSEIAQADLRGQMADVGEIAMQELKRRLEEKPKEFTVPQLHGTIDLLLTQPMKGVGAGTSQGAPQQTFQVNFVAPTEQRVSSEIEGEIVRGERRK